METEAKGIKVSGWVTGMSLTPASLGHFPLDNFDLCASKGNEFQSERIELELNLSCVAHSPQGLTVSRDLKLERVSSSVKWG